MESNILEVQKTVKDNASSMQDYLRDLDNWTKQMETKDEQLKKAKKNKKKLETSLNSDKNTDGTNLKASTSSTTPAKKSKTESLKIVPKENKKSFEGILKEKNLDIGKESKSKKITSFDYSAWDKFDVEAACEEVGNEAEDDSSEEEELENERLRQEAVAEKDRGNTLFKAGNWDQAIEKYTRGMQLDPLNCVLPANRAMALLKKDQFGAAESDCTLALSVDKTYVKAYQRRGTARVGLGKLDLALEDFNQVIKLEPGNKAAGLEIDKIEKKLVKDEDIILTEKKEGGMMNNTEITNKFDEGIKGAFLKSNSKSAVNDVNLSVVKVKHNSTKDRVNFNDKDDSVQENGRIFPVKKPNHLRSQKPLKRIQIIDIDSNPSNKSPDIAASKREDNLKVVSEPIPDSKSFGFVKKIENEMSTEISKVEVIESVPEVASSSSKFLSDWKQLKTLVNRSKYLRQFRESDYKKVFKSSLDGQLFSEMILVLHHLVQRGADPDIVVEQLRGLSGLPRVSAVAMFMSSQDQQKIRYLIGELECVNQAEKDEWIKTFSL